MENNKVTVLIISNDDKEVKSFKLSTNLISNYRKYLIWISSFVTFVFIILCALVFDSISQRFNNSGLTSRINLMNEQLEVYDSLKMLQKINSIDNNIAMINSYLYERGMLEMGNAGRESLSREKGRTIIDKINYFENKSVLFYKTLRDLPIGLPYYGELSSDYGYRRNPFGGYNGEFHPGLDFKGETGDPVYATGDGFIDRCDWYSGYGNAVVITHRKGFKSLYGHLSRVNVVQGQEVKAGDLIGFLGSTGRSTGPHLHYEIRKEGEDINPQPFLKLY